MSSIHPSQNSTPMCQRCRGPLPVNERLCDNCGFYNAALPQSNTQQRSQQPSAWNQAPSQSLHNDPQSNQSKQDGGLLKRYSAQAEQYNRYTSSSSFQAPQPQAAPSRPLPPQMPSVNGIPTQARRQPEMLPPVAQPPQTIRNSSGYAQPVSPSPFSTGPTTPPSSFNQMPPPAYTQASRSSYYEEPIRRRQPNVGRIVGTLILLLVLIGGSFLAYTFLFTHKNTQQTSHSTSSSNPTTNTVPQGTPLFHDNFTDNTNGWSIQSYPGEFSVALGNGALKLENDNNKLLWELVPGNKSYGDFQLSVDAVLSKGSQDNGYGVYFRSALSQNTSITNFYRFELYGDGSFAVFKGSTDANGTVTTPRLVDYTNSSAIQKQGSLNHITINAKGSSLQFIVNSQILSTISDATYASGSAALFVSNLQKAPPGAVATFSHLAIYSAQK